MAETPLHKQLGMTDDELAAVIEELGREPTHLELAMYSVMWSEHCSYKSSRSYLPRFSSAAPWVLVGHRAFLRLGRHRAPPFCLMRNDAL